MENCVDIVVECGRANIRGNEIVVKLSKITYPFEYYSPDIFTLGTMIQLEKECPVDNPAEIFVNNKLVAKAKIVNVIHKTGIETVGVSIAEVVDRVPNNIILTIERGRIIVFDNPVVYSDKNHICDRQEVLDIVVNNSIIAKGALTNISYNREYANEFKNFRNRFYAVTVVKIVNLEDGTFDIFPKKNDAIKCYSIEPNESISVIQERKRRIENSKK